MTENALFNEKKTKYFRSQKILTPTQGSPSGNPQVSPTKPSSVTGSTLARIVRGPGSVPGWGLSNA